MPLLSTSGRCVRQSAGDVGVHELVEGVVVGAAQVTRHIRLRHGVEVVAAQQLVLARTAVLDLTRLQALVTQPADSHRQATAARHCHRAMLTLKK